MTLFLSGKIMYLMTTNDVVSEHGVNKQGLPLSGAEFLPEQ